MVAAVPVANLRVPRSDFAHVWRTAERLNRESGRQGIDDWYPAGVAVTCRWLAGIVVTDQVGRRAPAPAPVTRRRDRAFEELIDAELLAAEAIAVGVCASVRSASARRPAGLDQPGVSSRW